jgi:excisionase family DNA binding protein
MTKEERALQRKITNKAPQGPVKRLYNIQEASCYLGRTVNALQEMIWAGKLPYVKDGKRILLDVRDMDSFIDRNKIRFTF